MPANTSSCIRSRRRFLFRCHFRLPLPPILFSAGKLFYKSLLTFCVYLCRIQVRSTEVDKKEVSNTEVPKIHEGEYRFCLILWKHEPVTAAQLAKLCLEQLGWKRTTTYTIIKRLGERGILKNENGLVTSLVSKDEAQACEIDELVEKKFEGSLPTFVAAFTKRQDLSERELDEVQQMIDRIRRGETQ